MNELLMTLVVVALFLGVSFVIYSCIDRARKKYIATESKRLDAKIRVVNLKSIPPSIQGEARMVTGSVAIANCYCLSFFASWKKIFGGEIRSYSQLATDARKIALIRLMQDAESWGAQWIFNVRYETSMQETKQNQNNQNHGLVLFAYATAIKENNINQK